MRRAFRALAAVPLLFALGLSPALGAVGQRTAASGASPFGPGACNTQPQSGTLYVGSEVEPWIDVDPTSAGDADGPDFIGVYQQDRYSSGGARGLGASVSLMALAEFPQLCSVKFLTRGR